MLHEWIGVAAFLAIGIGSARLYEPDHRSRDYAEGRPGTIESPRGFRFVYHWIRFSTIGIGIAALLSTHWIWCALEFAPWRLYVGLTIAVLGFVLFAASKRTLGKQYSPCFDAYLPTQLVSEGPYRYVRHPIYTANLLTLAGMAFGSGSAWLAANFLILGWYYARSARVEESALERELPGYSEYLERTGRFLPP